MPRSSWACTEAEVQGVQDVHGSGTLSNLLNLLNPLTPALPIDSAIPDILASVRESRAVVVTAAPGAGKTTRVPPALAVDGPVIVLQPRRVAARSLATRIAAERGWTIGNEVGWHVRFERRFGPATRVLFATEGILTARLQQDPLLGGFRTIILDEFHERSVHADLGIALAKQAWLARSDLRLVIMSATLDAAAVSTYLDDCPIVEVAGTSYPLDVRYAPGLSIADAVGTCLRETSGQILCFLPGAAEIGRGHRDVAPATEGVEIVELHGSLDAAAQDAAIAPATRRRIILSTNIAETSLTVPGVAAVVDTGLHKVARYDPERAVDSLETERISQDSADQRSGRAARLGPGVAIRLWDERDRLRAHREPEIQRVDLSATVLDILAWGGDPRAFDWFEPPLPERIDRAFDLLERLGATRDGRLTSAGRHIQRLPLHPRLSAILLAAGGAREAAIACAVLSERHYYSQARESSPPGIARRPQAICSASSRASVTCPSRSGGLPRLSSRSRARLRRRYRNHSARSRSIARSLPVIPIASRVGASHARRACSCRPDTERSWAQKAAFAMESFWSRWTSWPGDLAKGQRRGSGWQAQWNAAGSNQRTRSSSTCWIQRTAACAPCRASTTTR